MSNYVEPFFGSGAMLLGRPDEPGTETVNDLDGYVANFWRAIKMAPLKVAEFADNPVNENDLHARHVWLVQQRENLRAGLEGDHEWFDPKIAGFWVWGMCVWIAGGFCSGKGPWWVNDDRKLVRIDNGRGINRPLVHLGDNGRGINRQNVDIGEWFCALASRLRNVRVCSGDWARVCGPSVTFKHGLTAVFLDPPYADTAGRCSDVYRVDDLQVAHAVREWAIENGKHKNMRIALCGYEGEHVMPDDWQVQKWKATGGFEGKAAVPSGNSKRERIWYSPACLSARQRSLFDDLPGAA